MSALSITWLGHSTFIIITPGGKRIVTDPWLEGNPACPADRKRIDEADLILLSHGHSDHSGDVVTVARATEAPVVAINELSLWLERKGLQNVIGMGIGGTTCGRRSRGQHGARGPHQQRRRERRDRLPGRAGRLRRHAWRTASAIYFAGDTALFGDMRLIGEMYTPEIAFLPIGDHYTMGPEAAARACPLLGVRQVVPMHFGTFPLLTGTPDRLKQLVEPTGSTSWCSSRGRQPTNLTRRCVLSVLSAGVAGVGSVEFS